MKSCYFYFVLWLHRSSTLVWFLQLSPDMLYTSTHIAPNYGWDRVCERWGIALRNFTYSLKRSQCYLSLSRTQKMHVYLFIWHQLIEHIFSIRHSSRNQVHSCEQNHKWTLNSWGLYSKRWSNTLGLQSYSCG
jgi:hypothetical protein